MQTTPRAPTSAVERVATLARGAGVGIVATAVDLASLAVLVHAFGFSARVASVPALLLGVVIQFVGSKLVTFRNRDRAWGAQALRFAAVEAVGFAANVALFDVAVRNVALPPVALRLVTTNVIYFCVCLPLWARIFRGRTREEALG